METLYMTLGVAPTADDTEIRTAYRRLALRYHPDVSGEPKDAATSRFLLVQEAYEVLSDKQKRRIYDAAIHARATYAPPPSRSAPPPLITTLLPVRSSNIRAVGYDPLGGILEIAFIGGGIYRYYGVPEATYQAFMSAPSKGRFFHSSVGGRFPYQRISA